MEEQNMHIFFGVVFIVYGLIHFYLFRRGWQALQYVPHFRVFYVILFFILVFSFIAGRILENYFQNGFVDVLIWIGSFWLGTMVYLLLFAFVFDLGRFAFSFHSKFSFILSDQYQMLKLALFAIVLGISALVVIFGFWNARSPITQELKISIPKKVSGKTQWNIVAVSDVHLGTLVNRSRAEILTNSIMALRPDLVLFLGDTLDEDVASVTRRDIGVALKKITAPYGVYGITGNHEYIGGVEESVKYLEAHGITVLRDASVVINNAFELIGRDDRSNKNRKSLDELLAGISSSMPLILLDHQPFHLREVAKSSRVDLQLSGHTHHGQLWPFNFITSMIYEVSWGYMIFDETQFYVSSGWGTWGPPIRTGNTPELIHLTVLFDK